MMRKFILPCLVLTLALSACTAVATAAPFTSDVTPAGGTPAGLVITPPVTSTEITPTFEGCAYVWASQELPSLSKNIYQALQGLDPNLTGNAYAYGENCVYADGRSTFGAMETDFRVKVKVPDLKDERSLGDRISQVMGVITHLPADQVPGGEPGRVEFDFSKSDTEDLLLNVSIAKYQQDAAGLSGAELFKLFNNNP
jgi:hypothetical protein